MNNGILFFWSCANGALSFIALHFVLKNVRLAKMLAQNAAHLQFLESEVLQRIFVLNEIAVERGGTGGAGPGGAFDAGGPGGMQRVYHADTCPVSKYATLGEALEAAGRPGAPVCNCDFMKRLTVIFAGQP